MFGEGQHGKGRRHQLQTRPMRELKAKNRAFRLSGFNANDENALKTLPLAITGRLF